MKKLVLELWKPYFWDQEYNKFSGIKFENLVASLLKLKYPELAEEEKWHRTKQSWDGKKDFWQNFYENGKKALRWVECKSYEEAISFNLLAPTLIMSTLYQANEVIFFRTVG